MMAAFVAALISFKSDRERRTTSAHSRRLSAQSRRTSCNGNSGNCAARGSFPVLRQLGELARCDAADLVKLFGALSRRHDRTPPAVADVSMVVRSARQWTVSTDAPSTARRGGRPVPSSRARCCKCRIRRSRDGTATDLAAAPIGISPARTHRGRHALLAGDAFKLTHGFNPANQAVAVPSPGRTSVGSAYQLALRKWPPSGGPGASRDGRGLNTALH